MSNLWFNIKLGKYHWQLTRNWKISFTKNLFWDLDREAYKQTNWFVIYCAFGLHL